MTLGTEQLTKCVAVFLLMLLCVAHADMVFMIPKEYNFSSDVLGIPLHELLKDAIRVFNYSDLIITVPDNWQYGPAIREYLLHQQESINRAKRDNGGEEPLPLVHYHSDKRQVWFKTETTEPPSNFTDDVNEYVDELTESLTNDWGLDRIDQHSKTSPPLDGNYLGFVHGISDLRVVHLYVIDTGVATHPNIPQTISYDFSYFPDDPADCNGHGTHVAGIAMSTSYGVSPGTNHIIHSIKVLDCFGLGDTTGVLAGLSWVKANYQEPAVINLSIGIKGIPSSLSTMIKSMRALGIVIVAAAGNQGDNACLYFPSGITSSGDIPVVGVGALALTLGSDDSAATFSNYGSCVRVYAPGDKIQSTLPGGFTGLKSGTSMASPFVAGAIVLALATTPSLTAVQAQDLVLGRVTEGIITGANVFSGTNNLLYVPPAENQPTIPPALATTTAVVSTSTTRAATTASALATTTSTARATTLGASTTAARTTSTRASTSATTSAHASTTRATTSTRAASTSTTRASTTGRSSTTRATTAAASATRSATTSAHASTSRSITSSISTTRAATTNAAHATTTGRASTTRGITSTNAATRGTTTAAAHATTSAHASTSKATTTAHSSTTRGTTTARSTTRGTTTAASRATTTAHASTSRTTTSTRSASTRATTTGRASTTRASTTTRAATN